MKPSASHDTDGYQKLNARAVVATLSKLQRRVAIRFPERNIADLAGELVQVAREVSAGVDRISGRLQLVRFISRGLIVAVIVITFVALFVAFRGISAPEGTLDWVSLIESTINDLVFAVIAIYFLRAWPERVERRHYLTMLYKLRSIAHVIDMHQLTKDPDRLRADYNSTSESPQLDLTADEVQHYLEYCSEMLSLVGKVAAICAEKTTDNIVLDTVSTVENLTTGLTRKIWQKISLLP